MSDKELENFFLLQESNRLPDSDALIAPPHRRVYVAVSPATENPTALPLERLTETPITCVDLLSDDCVVHWDMLFFPGGKCTSNWVVIRIPDDYLIEMSSTLSRCLRNLAMLLLCTGISSRTRCILEVLFCNNHDEMNLIDHLRRITFVPPLETPPASSGASPVALRLLVHGRDDPSATTGFKILRAHAKPGIVECKGGSDDPKIDIDDAVVASGVLADFQEAVLASESQITVVQYDKDRFRTDGVTFALQMRDALKWNWVVHTLDLGKSSCGPVLPSVLGSILHTNRYLRTLRLTMCSLTEAAGIALAKVICKSETVEVLDLSRNPGLGSDSLYAFGAALIAYGDTSRLRDIDLSHNNSLYIEQLKWTDESLRIFVDGASRPKYLRTLRMANCGLSARNACDLAALYLQPRQKRYDEETAAWVQCQRSVQMNEDIASSPLGPQAFDTIDLSSNQFGDVGIAAVFDKIRSAAWVKLSHCGVTPRGFRAIAATLRAGENRHIHNIDLSSNDADPVSGYSAEIQRHDILAECEVTATPGVTLCLSEHIYRLLTQDAADDVAPCEHIANALRSTESPHHLDLRKCSIGDKGVVALCNLLLESSDTGCGLSSLFVGGNINLTEEGCAHKIKEMLSGGFFGQKPKTTLLHLDLSDTHSGIGERALLAMYKNSNLRTLNISNLGLRDGALVPFCDLKAKNAQLTLTDVDLSGNAIRTDGLRSLVLWLRQCSEIVKRLALRRIWFDFEDDAGKRTSLSQQPYSGAALLAPLLLLMRYPPPILPPNHGMSDIQQAIQLATNIVSSTIPLRDDAPQNVLRLPKSSPMAHRRMQNLLLKQSKHSPELLADQQTEQEFSSHPLALVTLDLRENDASTDLTRLFDSARCAAPIPLSRDLCIFD